MEPNSASPPKQYISPYPATRSSATGQAKTRGNIEREYTTQLQVDKDAGDMGHRTLRERKKRPNYSIDSETSQSDEDLRNKDTGNANLSSEQVNDLTAKKVKGSDSSNVWRLANSYKDQC